MYRNTTPHRIPCTILLLIGLVTVVTSTDIVAQQDGNPINHKALWDQANLVLESSKLPVRRTRQSWTFEKRVGSYLIGLNGNILEVLDFESMKPIWKETGTPDNEYRLIGTNEGTLYLVEETIGQNENASATVSILRRELPTGNKLEPIVIEENSTVKRGSSRVIGAITKPNCVYLLTMLFSATDDFSSEPVSYRLTKFSDKLEWSKSFVSAGAIETPGAFLLGSFGPALDGTSSQSLVEMGSKIVVSAGPLEDIMAIDSQSGEVAWTIPRLWEYRRGFIGPSVWSYFLGRYGMEDHDIKTATETSEHEKDHEYEQDSQELADEEYLTAIRERVKNARKRIESEKGWIFAGPVVIKTGNEVPEERLFVVTAQSDGNSSWPNYLANAVVYEISDGGKLISMLTLPRLLDRNEFVVLSDRVIWICNDGAALELFPMPDAFSNDTFTKINWKSASQVPTRKAWLRQGVYYLTRDFFESRMVSIVEGGFLEQSDSQEIKYPILLTDLNSGKKKEVLLCLPFQGQATTPTKNYSRSPNGWVTWSGYLFTVDGILVDEQIMSVSIRNAKDERTILEFDMLHVIEALNKQ